MSSPTTSEEICSKYDLQADDFAAMPSNIRALYRAAYAADVLHVQEEPPIGSEGNPDGSANSGPDVERYLEICGLGAGNPWCAAFGTAMLVDSGVGLSELPDGPASVHSWLDWAKAKNYASETPERGFAGLIIESPTAGHFVFVSDLVEGEDSVKTIEGNTNEDGSREGYGVFRRERPYSEFHCFANLSYLTS
jgi:hypothetical protein